MNGPPSSNPNEKLGVNAPVHAGDVLSNKFRVERVLGVGGMGVVVAATHLQLGQLVALKFMLRDAMQYSDNVARFDREARAAVRLRSDHVAKVTDVGRLDDGAPYMVMEFLEGEDLDHYLRHNGPLPIQTAVDFVLQAAEAISEAHALGIVHRDLKPKNLFLAKRLNGEPLVKVLDFGVSKIVGGEELSLTQTTQVLGSPVYMSPEQLRASRDVDHRTDIWALGSILYELLAGDVPFPATTLTQLTAMVIAEPPRPIETLRADVPPALRAAIMRCLEKPVTQRFQSVADFAAALSPFASASSVALATQRMIVSSSSSRVSTGSGQHPSGVNTDVAWNRTEVAMAPPGRRRPVLPIAIAVGAVSMVLAAVVVVGLRHHDAKPASRTPAAPSAPGSVIATPVTVASIEHVAPLTIAPPTDTSAIATHAAPIVTTARASPKRDAGTHVVAPTANTFGGLPISRD